MHELLTEMHQQLTAEQTQASTQYQQQSQAFSDRFLHINQTLTNFTARLGEAEDQLKNLSKQTYELSQYLGSLDGNIQIVAAELATVDLELERGNQQRDKDAIRYAFRVNETQISLQGVDGIIDSIGAPVQSSKPTTTTVRMAC